MLIKTITKVPDEIFNPAAAEIESVKWENVNDVDRSSRKVFESSQSINVRRHKITGRASIPKSIEEWSVITECEDVPSLAARFPLVYKTAQWMVEQVGGIALGRIMIVNLLPHGKVPLHIDPLDYFAMYSRFHIPFKTNTNVVFSGGPDTAYEHMPFGHLSQLNNRLPHMLENNSDENRIHIIVDIALPGGNQIF